MAEAVFIAALFYGHILSAMAWLGGGMMIAFVVGPRAKSMSPSANLEFAVKVIPGVLRLIQVAVGSTFLFGLLLYYFLEIPANAPGATELFIGVGLALVTSAVVFLVTIPSFKRVVRIAQERIASGVQGPPPPELMKYGKRARMGSLAGIALLLVVLGLMIATSLGL